MPSLKNTPRRHAFTLIELLTVIAIVLILAATVVPVVSMVRQSGYRAQCASNLRQIGAGLFLHAEDHDGKLPAVSKQWQPSSADGTWAHVLWPYVGYSEADYQTPENDLIGRTGADRNIFHCPSTKQNPVAAPNIASGVNSNRTSYGLNPFPLTATDMGWVTAHKSSPIPMDAIRTPSRTAMVNECSFFLGGWEGYYQYFGLVPHEGGSNVLFYDGHVEWKAFEDIPNRHSDVFWR